MCIFRLFVNDPQLQPDPKMMFLHPMSRQEYIHNLQHVHHIQYKNNVPIYLQPQEFLDNVQPEFLMLQLYYLYCKYKNSNPLCGPPGSKNQAPEMVFRDHGRKQAMQSAQLNQAQNQGANNMNKDLDLSGASKQSQTSQSQQNNQNSKINTSSEGHSAGPGTGPKGIENTADAQSRENHTMGIIEEEDSLDFSSSVRSQFQVQGGLGSMGYGPQSFPSNRSSY